MNLIVAVNSNWSIGDGKDMLYHLPTDLKYFKEKTIGKTVILGRKTLESFPKSKPLPNRKHILLTSNYDRYKDVDGIEKIFSSKEELILYIDTVDSDELFVIGGGQIYNMLLPYCKYAYVTKIYDEKKSSVYFPNLDDMETWKQISKSDIVSENGIDYNFLVYENKNL